MISVCIPAYKHVAMTHEAALSVLQQDVDVELVVLDDFNLVEPTQDNFHAIESLRQYLHSDKRVKCFSNKELLPIQDNWNKVVSLCTGSHVKLMGADDRLLPGSLANMMRMIRERPTIAFHGHLANIIDSTGKVIRRQRPYGQTFINQPITRTAALRGKLRQQVRFKEPICNFYLKSVWENVGGYDRKLRFAFDVAFNVKMISISSIMLWNEYLVELRRHEFSDGAQLPASLALADLKAVIDAIGRSLGSEYSTIDRAAACGLLQYRIIELTAQRIKNHPREIASLIINNFSLFFSNPISYYWMSRFIYNRIFLCDVQQW